MEILGDLRRPKFQVHDGLIPMVGSVEKSLLEQIAGQGSIHMTLIDPEKVTPPQASRIALKAKISGTAAIMIGGSTFVSPAHLDDVVKIVRRTVKCSDDSFSEQRHGHQPLRECYMVHVSSELG